MAAVGAGRTTASVLAGMVRVAVVVARRVAETAGVMAKVLTVGVLGLGMKLVSLPTLEQAVSQAAK